MKVAQQKVIIEDQDGGFIVAVLDRPIHESSADEPILIYKYKEYYHDLMSAIREEFYK